jgi:hypothetical protein
MKERFIKALRDTIRSVFKIVKKKETKRADRAIVTTALTVLHQKDEIVLEGEIVLMLYGKGYQPY